MSPVRVISCEFACLVSRPAFHKRPAWQDSNDALRPVAANDPDRRSSAWSGRRISS
jgi:hypothetical protein